jgi:hypothetical protein
MMGTKQLANKWVHATRSAIIILIIFFLLAEFTLRIYNSFNPLFIFYDTSYNRFRGKPFADDWDFKLNSQGFKDVEFSRQNNQNYRILGLGDSFAYGVVPYKNNYLTRLELQFQQEAINVEVLNMGIPSIGPKEYLSLLVREGLGYHPDMVLLSFYIGNDFMDSYKSRKWYTYSYMASLVHYILALQRKYEGRIIHGKGIYCDDCPNFDQAAYLEIEKERSFIFSTESADFVRSFDAAVDSLKQIQDICNKNGIKLVVVIIPDEMQVNPPLETDVKRQLSVKEGKWDITLPNARLAKKLNDMGVDYLDLYPILLKKSQEGPLYRPRDSHWNIAGNQFAANIIQSHIRKYLNP